MVLLFCGIQHFEGRKFPRCKVVYVREARDFNPWLLVYYIVSNC